MTTRFPLFPIFLVVGLLAVLALPAGAQERILRYDVDLTVNADASLDVVENITVRAEGSQIRRGIHRDFPTRYRDRAGNNIVVELEVQGVERDGRTEPWFTERMSNGVRINTGNDDFLHGLPADIRYTIRYRTTRQLGFFANHDELYWNAIGTGWVFPVDAADVRLRLPQPVPVQNMSAEGYTGPQGAKGQDYASSLDGPGQASWRLTAPLRLYEGFTVVLTFPKGLVPAPTTGQRIGWLLKDNRGVLVALAGFLAMLAFCVHRWRKLGRDPRAGVIIARYEPPEGRSPAELRYLRRHGYDDRCFTADLLTLAVAGHVRIDREKRLLRRDAWALERTGNEGNGRIAPTALTLFKSLFAGIGRRLELEKKNAQHLQEVRKQHTQALDQRLHGEYFRRNGGSAGIALLIAIVTGVAAFAVSGGAGILAIVLVCVAMLIVLGVFTWLVQAPTEKGRRLLDEVEGLKLYLGVAERDELKNMPGPDAPPPLDAERYERLLPYAVALDVEDAWTGKFTLAVGAAAAAAVTAGIAWYRGGGTSDLGGLARSVGSSLSSSIASASSPPGSSSGGGGGGSSGGGGGGGGGGGR